MFRGKGRVGNYYIIILGILDRAFANICNLLIVTMIALIKFGRNVPCKFLGSEVGTLILIKTGVRRKWVIVPSDRALISSYIGYQ